MRAPRWRVSGSVLRRWLVPGIGIKRWLLVVFAGELLLALAGALLLRQVYREYDLSGPGQGVLYIATLQFLPYWLRGAIVGGLGLTVFTYGSWRVVRALMGPFLTTESDQPLVEVIYQKRFLSRGPKVAVIGGGTGLSTLLRGIKEHTSNITAVVTVADDGGSSGRLREELGIPAVGDIMVTGVGTLGICYVVKKDDRFYFKDGNIIWLKKKTEANSRFVEYAFRSEFLRTQIDDSVGATVGTYTIIKAKNTLVPLPSPSEQHRVVEQLDSLREETHSLASAYERKLTALESLKKSLLHQAFSGQL